MRIDDHIIVKDNFFTEEILNKIQNEMSNLNFANRNTTVNEQSQNVYQKIYFNVPLYKEHFAEEVTQVVILMVNEEGTIQVFKKNKVDYLPKLKEAVESFYKWVEEKNGKINS